jgi:transcriptional regulator with PAS, ATPase and Fis domain
MSSAQETLCTLTDLGDDSVLLPAVRVMVTLPQGETIEVPLGMDPLLVGTSPECDLVVADARISRRHCELRLTRRGIILRDLGSKNGTFIGEVPIFEVILPPSVSATLGSSRLSVKAGGAPSLVPLSVSHRFGEAIGKSVSMRALFAKLKLASETSETILLLGESGTGKEILAKAIHANSLRVDGPFVVFDCSAIAPSLVEAELFGYARGAFTGAVTAHEGLLEQASGGTLFIDELGELPLELQPKLLRAIEAREVRRLGSKEWRSFDARVIAATHRNLRAQVAAGTFREDLYYRLAVVEVHVPALRDRKDDIPLLAEAFLAAREPPRVLADLPAHALSLLAAHDWPGNVRELRNTVARLVLFPDLGREVFGPSLAARSTSAMTEGTSAASALKAEETVARGKDEGLGSLLELPLLEARDVVIEQFDRKYLTEKLREHGGNISRAADAIGVSRQLVHRLIERYGLRRSGEGSREGP